MKRAFGESKLVEDTHADLHRTALELDTFVDAITPPRFEGFRQTLTYNKDYTKEPHRRSSRKRSSNIGNQPTIESREVLQLSRLNPRSPEAPSRAC